MRACFLKTTLCFQLICFSGQVHGTFSTSRNDDCNSCAIIRPLSNSVYSLDIADSLYYFLSKKAIQNLGMKSIKIYNNSRDDTDGKSGKGFTEYVFNKGKLSTELSFDDLKITLIDAQELEYHYYYSKTKIGKSILEKRDGDAYNGHSQEDHLTKYFYKNDLLVKTEYTTSSLYKKKTSITGKELKYYRYNNKIQLDSIENIDNENKSTFQYFIYNESHIIAYFPAKTPDDMGIKTEDLIYFTKTQEIKKIGFKAFKNKYLVGSTYDKIVDDCYESIDYKDIIIDGLDISQYFLKKQIHLRKYLVIEVSDNYFLFLKII
jgi:hypothetical protein